VGRAAGGLASPRFSDVSAKMFLLYVCEDFSYAYVSGKFGRQRRLVIELGRQYRISAKSAADKYAEYLVRPLHNTGCLSNLADSMEHLLNLPLINDVEYLSDLCIIQVVCQI
jgi:hypothetical protein